MTPSIAQKKYAVTWLVSYMSHNTGFATMEGALAPLKGFVEIPTHAVLTDHVIPVAGQDEIDNLSVGVSPLSTSNPLGKSTIRVIKRNWKALNADVLAAVDDKGRMEKSPNAEREL